MGNSNARKIFEQLDKDKSGKVSLSELLNSDEQLGSSFSSLTTLYHFDLGKEGKLNYKEFVEMDKFVQRIKHQVEKETEDKEKHLHESHHHSATSDVASIIGKLFGRSTSNENLENHNQSLDTLSSYGSGNVSPTSAEKLSVKFFASPSKSPTCKRLTSEHAFSDLVKDRVNYELLPALHKEMFCKEGRKNFLNWLFKLSDVDRSGRISRKQLELILKAVQKDGIDLECLLFDTDSDEEHNHHSTNITNHILTHEEEVQKFNRLVDRIMDEYDVEGHGFLNQQEFMKLGEIILTKYEALHLENTDSKIIGDWKMTHILGRGSYGVVRYAHHVDDYNEKRAIKIIKRGNVSDMSRLDIEIQAMQMLKHKNVVQLYEVLEDDEYVYLVIELCGGGSLYEHIKDKPFDEKLARYYFNQLVDGLSYCHEMGVCHRDLRLENLLLDNEGHLKITDFGQARIFKKGWDLFSTQLVGSLYHLSPEQIEGKVYAGEKIDIWSAGIILYCFVTSKLPFCSSDVNTMFDDIKNARYTYPDDVEVSVECQELIFGMLQPNPKVRATLKQIKEHRWTKGPQSQPNLMLETMLLNGFFEKNKHIPNLHKIIGRILMDILKQFDCHFKVEVKKKDIRLPTSSSQVFMGNTSTVSQMVRVSSDSDMSCKSDRSEDGEKDELPYTPHSASDMRSSASCSMIDGPRQKPILTIDTTIKKSPIHALSTDASPLLLQPFLILRCIHAKKDVKFLITAEETENNSLAIIFALRDGETKEFKSKVAKMKPEIMTRLTS
ncbi:hypothetical protein C9374_014595 [Naegleria lovaniensis]|uniref:Uncharacterized protein n=1 Tax=Naegleria lovaniensis TaxID=51637 RepID=A0AA88GUL3_NAELO|nr:uncharacterized protein C9374_014595 [Naegleria lovaniensis]KAG2389195.1 hypothetical protein C9374_014595 [Naegleria lovaniensis]